MARLNRRAVVGAASSFLILPSILPSVANATPRVDKPAPDFHAVTFSGEKIALKDLAGDVIVLNFWATWCGPCRTEMPMLDRYYRLRKEYGLRVLAIATEDSVPEQYLKPLAKVLAIPLVKIFKGPYGPIDNAVPSNIVIDRAGVLRYAKAAALDLDDMNGVLVPLLREPAPESQTQS